MAVQTFMAYNSSYVPKLGGSFSEIQIAWEIVTLNCHLRNV